MCGMKGDVGIIVLEEVCGGLRGAFLVHLAYKFAGMLIFCRRLIGLFEDKN